TAAAAAATPAPVVTARAFTLLMRVRCKASGRFLLLLRRLLRLRGLITSRFGDRDLLDMRLRAGRRRVATATPAPPPPAAPPRSAIAGFANRGGEHGFALDLGFFGLACLAADFFEIVLFFKRRHRGLSSLGDRLCRLGRMHLLAAIDHKSLRRTHGFVRGDG